MLVPMRIPAACKRGKILCFEVCVCYCTQNVAREIDKVQSNIQLLEEAILFLQTAVWRDELINKR